MQDNGIDEDFPQTSAACNSHALLLLLPCALPPPRLLRNSTVHYTIHDAEGMCAGRTRA